ncbi:uncharacterized protein LOC121787440 isoform X1 [Salvia splendens]|uniref:uncharacterized protein LOC121787440 isoform X1 n=1 Tax=Salvia splendens TaxID=180675 RepID=UPI001C255E77|nr:uncharacterized protein LOC121787440 isoform X1 [Salvia splendens]
MSTSRGSAAGNGGGSQLIPAVARKVVLSLKEVVNFSDAEIYAVLKDCDMDPNEAVNRLVLQDPFLEVKSKREKKKEGKDNHDSRPHGANNSARRSRNSADRRGASSAYSASATYNASESKPTYKKENGSASYKSNISSAAGVLVNNRSQLPSGLSDGSATETKGSSLGAADGKQSVATTASGYQSAWGGVPGQVSMADIVRMGKPHNKASHQHIQDVPATEPFPHLRSTSDHASKAYSSEVSTVQHAPSADEWPVEKPEWPVEKPAPTNVIPVPEHTVDAELYPEASGVSDGISQHYEEEEVQESEDDDIGKTGGNDLSSAPVPHRKAPENDLRGSSLFEKELYQNMASYQSEAPDYECHEGEEVGASVASVTENFQKLSVEKDDAGFPSEENAPLVVIPDHLQVEAADCSHLSFGSFVSKLNASYPSGGLTSVPVKSNLDEGHNEADTASAVHSDTRQSGYYVDNSLRDTSDRFHVNGQDGVIAGTYDEPSASQPEELKPESTEVAQGNQYPFQPVNPGYALDDTRRLNAAFNETSSQMHNLAQFSNVMQQSYPNSLQSSLLTGNVHSARESDLQYSQFPVSHTMAAKYGNSISSVGASAISMSEALNTANSSPQPTAQSHSGANVAAMGPPLPQQHVAVHPYSQPTLPLGPFANMISYPFLPQSYTYMPSAFQQPFAGNSTYHQSLAALLPQYKSSVAVSSLPQSAAVPSGYSGLGNTATVPGNYQMNPPAAPSGAAINYEEVLAQYKESQLLPLQQQQQQNENQAMWLHGQGSRTVQAVPTNAYYNYQGQSQQSGVFRQAQQQSQNYGTPGYPNFYHSQAGISLDQQQNPRDGALGAPQGQPKQSQMWPNGY